MSAAANAAGHLYFHGRLPTSDLSGQVDAESSHQTAESQSSKRLEPKAALRQDQSQPVKEARIPRIEYRKRRFYPLPSAA